MVVLWLLSWVLTMKNDHLGDLACTEVDMSKLIKPIKRDDSIDTCIYIRRLQQKIYDKTLIINEKKEEA